MTDKISALVEKLKENPENRFHRYNLAQAFFDAGEYQKAKLEFISCLEQSKDWMMVLLFVAKCCCVCYYVLLFVFWGKGETGTPPLGQGF